jgi:predicted amino acid-binding ACT domain protein
MTNPTHLLTVLTPDRRGIIAGITGVLDAADARLLELSQTVVHDYFTILMSVVLPDSADLDEIKTQIQSNVAEGAAVTLLAHHTVDQRKAQGDSYFLTATGNDSPGLVHTISDIVAERGGNFYDLSSRVTDGQISMVAEIDLPKAVALDQLQIDLQHATTDSGLQVRLQHHRLFIATNEIAFRRVVNA